MEEKQLDNNTDTSSARGLSMDQRIKMKNLDVRNQMISDRQRESSIVALSIEEGVATRQLEQAERRAELQCPECDATNVFWMKFDRLLEK